MPVTVRELPQDSDACTRGILNMAQKQGRSMVDGKLIRISAAAHRAQRLGAACADMKMEDWASEVLIKAAAEALKKAAA